MQKRYKRKKDSRETGGRFLDRGGEKGVGEINFTTQKTNNAISDFFISCEATLFQSTPNKSN
jgi:hypothetical protein